jgi:hypothetical protein
MGVTGDRYEGTFDGHKIELVRNNVDKTLNLLIDGAVVASEQRWLPKDITLHAEFEHKAVKHTVVAHQHLKRILGLPIDHDDSIEVDGKPLPLKKTK